MLFPILVISALFQILFRFGVLVIIKLFLKYAKLLKFQLLSKCTFLFLFHSRSIHSSDKTYWSRSVQHDGKVIFPSRIETLADHNFVAHCSRLTSLLGKDSTVNHFWCNGVSFVSAVQNTTRKSSTVDKSPAICIICAYILWYIQQKVLTQQNLQHGETALFVTWLASFITIANHRQATEFIYSDYIIDNQ